MLPYLPFFIPTVALYDRLVKDSVKINFRMDPSLDSYAAYRPSDCSILFKAESSINCEQLAEEISMLYNNTKHFMGKAWI